MRNFNTVLKQSATIPPARTNLPCSSIFVMVLKKLRTKIYDRFQSAAELICHPRALSVPAVLYGSQRFPGFHRTAGRHGALQQEWPCAESLEPPQAATRERRHFFPSPTGVTSPLSPAQALLRSGPAATRHELSAARGS